MQRHREGPVPSRRCVPAGPKAICGKAAAFGVCLVILQYPARQIFSLLGVKANSEGCLKQILLDEKMAKV